MTRIDRAGIGPTEAAPAAGESRDPVGERGDWFSSGSGLGRDTRFGQHGLGAEFSDARENAFLDKVRQALGDAAEAPAGGDDRSGLRLLAVAGEAPRPAMPAPSADGKAPAGGRMEWIGALVERIERALHAPPPDAARAGISLRLAPGDGEGITGLTITMSPGGIDVVLTRGGGEATAAFVAAAQALADRLQARFPQRSVRVHETRSDEAREPAEGLDTISRLLGRPGARP